MLKFIRLVFDIWDLWVLSKRQTHLWGRRHSDHHSIECWRKIKYQRYAGKDCDKVRVRRIPQRAIRSIEVFKHRKPNIPRSLPSIWLSSIPQDRHQSLPSLSIPICASVLYWLSSFQPIDEAIRPEEGIHVEWLRASPRDQELCSWWEGQKEPEDTSRVRNSLWDGGRYFQSSASPI